MRYCPVRHTADLAGDFECHGVAYGPGAHFDIVLCWCCDNPLCCLVCCLHGYLWQIRYFCAFGIKQYLNKVRNLEVIFDRFKVIVI